MPISDRHRAGRRRVIPALLILMAASACQMTLPAGGSGSAPDTASLDAGQVIVRGPAGFCVDARSLRSSGPRQFALLAQCDILRAGQIEGVSSLSFLTVTAVRSDNSTPLPTAQQLAEAFGPARILRQTTRRGVLLVQLSDGGQKASKNATPVHWRGVMRVPGHTLGLAAYSTQGGAATDLDGRDLLLDLAANISSATARTATGDSVAVQKPAE